MNKTTISDNTILAIDALLALFTEEQRKILEINSNNVVISLAQQFTARWWHYEPVDSNKLVFQAKAAQILEAQKGWIEFMQEIKQDNLFNKLLRPENYKQKSFKLSNLKGTDKKFADINVNSADLTRTIGRSIAGAGGINRAYDYSTEWDKVDRDRLDAMAINRRAEPTMQETGEQDDSPEQEADIKDWIHKQERLDQVQPMATDKKVPTTRFSDGREEVPGSQMQIFDTAIHQNSTANAVDRSANTVNFIDGLRRQSSESTSETLVLAEAINNIQNIDFVDVRERFLQKFDVLFNYRIQPCQ